MVDSSSSVDPEALRLLRAGRPQEALPLAEHAVEGARACLPGHSLLASILLQLGRDQDAAHVAEQASRLEGTAEAYDGLAYVSMSLNQHERANELYRLAAGLSPQTPRAWYNLACSERSLGRLVEAEEASDRCLALDPANARTYLLRSELRIQTPDANHIRELQTRLDSAGLDAGARAHLGYALAKELDDVGRYDAAFAAFVAAARARRAQITYDIAGDELRLDRLAAAFPRTDSKEEGAPGADARAIFIVGLPRSGTTLVERILSGLANVRSNGETDHFSKALTAGSRGSGDMFERAAAADWRIVATRYAQLARLNASAGAVIEKLPTNYLYLGAIRRAMPDAKIVLVRRSALDSCFAMYRTLFGDAYPFTYDFLELARYYAAFERLIGHWRNVLGQSLYEISYEDLVREPRRHGAEMAAKCDLVWTDQAIDIQQNASVSLTASAAQVRRPIYGSSSGRWRCYRRHLEPLIRALRNNGVELPEDA